MSERPEASDEANNYLAQALGDLGVLPGGDAPPQAATQAVPAQAAPTQSAAPAPVARPVVQAAAPAQPASSLAGLAQAAMSAAVGTKLQTATPDEAEAAADAAEAEDAVPPEAAATEKSRSAWTGVKRENKELKAKLAQLEGKLKSGDPEADQKIQALTEQIAEYEDKIGRLDLTQSKTFKNKYEGPVNALRNRSVQVLMRYTGRNAEDAQALVQALERADTNDIQQAISEEPPAVQGALLQNLIEMQEATATRDRALSDWKNTKSAVEVSGSKDEEAEVLRQIVAQTTDAVKVLAATPEEGGEGSWLLAEQPDNPQWQEQRQKIVSATRAALRDKKEIPKLVMEGIAAGIYRKLSEQLYQENQELKNSVSSRDRVRPRLNGRPPERRPQGTVPVPSDPSDFVTHILGDEQ